MMTAREGCITITGEGFKDLPVAYLANVSGHVTEVRILLHDNSVLIITSETALQIREE